MAQNTNGAKYKWRKKQIAQRANGAKYKWRKEQMAQKTNGANQIFSALRIKQHTLLATE